VFHELLSRGGFSSGGLNFDAKIRRQSIDPDDLIHAHVGSMDACARALLAAADMLDAGVLTAPLAKRYEGWAGPEGRAILGGQRSLAELADRAHGPGFDPQPRSGRQEYLESLVNRYV
jgi:xylose isomerase